MTGVHFPSEAAAEARTGAPEGGPAAAGQGTPPAPYALNFRAAPLLPHATLWRWAMVLGVILGTAVGLGRRLNLSFIGETTLDWLLGGAMALLLLIALLLRGRRSGSRTPPIELLESHLSIPKSETSRRSVQIRYRDLLSLELVGASLVIGARRSVHIYPLASLEQPARAEELRSKVQGRIARERGGAELLEKLRRREALGAALRVRPMRITQLLLLLLWAIFALEHTSGALREPLGLLRWGANVPLLVAGGHIELLVSGGFLHLGFIHLVVNSASLLVLGMILERALGAVRFGLVYLCATVAGAALSALLSSTLFSVGASSAVFGLLGALALLQLRFGTELPAGFRQPPLRWVFLLAVNGLLPLFIPQLDVAAHVGGFAAGMLCAALICRDQAALHSRWPSRLVALLALAALLGSALALARVAITAIVHRAPYHLPLAQSLLQSADRDAPAPWQGGVLNVLAWHWAVAPAPTAAELSIARHAAERALALDPNSHATLDTLATVAYRQQDFERAIEAERRAEQLAPQPFYRAQIARFLAARWRQTGVLRLGTGGERAQATLVSPATPATPGQLQLALSHESHFTGGAELWFLHHVHDQVAGAAVVRLGPGSSTAPRTLTLEGVELGSPAARLDVALIDLGGCQGCPSGSLEGSYEVMDPAALALP